MFLRYLPSSLLRAALFVSTAALVVLPTALAYPRIGYDYGYFLPRLADTFLYFKSNGASIQWWTPTFGGGLPVFPNPQDMQLSLPQLFTFVSNPFVAVCITLGLVIIASCYALHRLARGPLAWDEAPACLLAVAVSTGGFLTLRMTAGQASYHAFALTPLLLLLAMDREIPRRLAIPVVGLLGAYFVHSGGYFVSFAAGLSLAIAVPVVILLAPRARGLLSALGVLAGGATLGLSLSVAKLFAVYSWMKQFPRTPGTHALPEIYSPMLQLLGTPILTLLGVGGLPSEFHRTMFEQPWDPWETDASLSIPVVLASLVAIPILLRHVLRRGTAYQRRLAGMAVVGGVLVWSLALGRGPVFELLREIPGLNGIRVNVRFTAVFLLPVGLIGVFALVDSATRFRGAMYRSAIVWSLVGIVLIQQAGYLGLVSRYPDDLGIAFNAGRFLDFSDRMRASPERVGPIREVANVFDPVAVETSRSSLLVYEPLLGAYIQNSANYTRRTRVRVGPADGIDDGSFNMHFPVAFAYPASVRMPPFSRIRAEHHEELNLFLSRRAPGWELPANQRAANVVSVTALVLITAWMLALLHPRMRGPFPRRAGEPDRSDRSQGGG
jgi:hypothetical protein